MLKRIAAPFVFGFVYFVGLIAIRYNWHIEENNMLQVAIGLLGILLAFYACFYLLGSKKFFWDTTDFEPLEMCIAKVKSTDYGDEIYYPYVKYRYKVNRKTYISTNVCFDMKSCYKTIWYEQKAENKGLSFAEEKLRKISQYKKVFYFKLYPKIAYLDIELRLGRKVYFYILAILAVVFIGFSLSRIMQ